VIDIPKWCNAWEVSFVDWYHLIEKHSPERIDAIIWLIPIYGRCHVLNGVIYAGLNVILENFSSSRLFLVLVESNGLQKSMYDFENFWLNPLNSARTEKLDVIGNQYTYFGKDQTDSNFPETLIKFKAFVKQLKDIPMSVKKSLKSSEIFEKILNQFIEEFSGKYSDNLKNYLQGTPNHPSSIDQTEEDKKALDPIIQMPSPQYDYRLNFKLIGDRYIGKSCLLMRFTENLFDEPFFNGMMSGVSFAGRSIDVDSKRVRIHIWDIFGSEKVLGYRPSYYGHAQGFIIVFDVTNVESSKKLPFWVEEIKRNARKPTLIMVLGTKIDLGSERKVTYEWGKQFADNLGILYSEASAKTGEGVKESFLLLEREAIKLEEKKKEEVAKAEQIKLEEMKNNTWSRCF